MKGDFTRDTFEPARHYSRVLMQQGRVQLDADWNEQGGILLHYLRTLARDLVGPHAGPADHCGFEIITDEAELPAVAAGQRLEDLQAALKKGDFVIGPGRYYVDGILIENEAAILCTEQPGYPFEGSRTVDDLRRGEAIAYLDVWERHVTYVEDERLQEVALGGPDTCSRSQVVWQVKILGRVGESSSPQALDCRAVEGLPHLGSGTLRARARLDKAPELCVIPRSSRYRGVENQLYRVEVHQARSATEPATFKWSRENGSVIFPIRRMDSSGATLEHLGRDAHLGLDPGDWVEVQDDDVVLSGRPGLLAQVEDVLRDDLRVKLSFPASAHAPRSYGPDHAGLHPLLRRWDHHGSLHELGGALAIDVSPETWVELEEGVEILFEAGGDVLPGDYWLIPARTSTGDVEWPDDDKTLDPEGKPVSRALGPRGTYHSFAPLWLATSSTATGTLRGHDCRCCIPAPCPTYTYGYGRAAIGAENISRPRPGRTKGGKR